MRKEELPQRTCPLRLPAAYYNTFLMCATDSVTLEFQGGEPLLNWPVVKFLTEHARKFNTLGKNLNIVLVTNMLLMDEEKMRFLADHAC